LHDSFGCVTVDGIHRSCKEIEPGGRDRGHAPPVAHDDLSVALHKHTSAFVIRCRLQRGSSALAEARVQLSGRIE